MRNERGFTLIELLVVIAILAVLFGLTALALNNIDTGKDETMTAEKDVVQTAIDVYMAQNDSLSDSTSTGNTVKVGPNTPEFGTYLRRTSKYAYCWDANGTLTQTENPGGGTGCP